MFGKFSLGFTDIDSRCMNQVAGIIFDNFLNCWMIMADANKSIIGLQIDVSVALMIVEILKVTLCDN